MNPDDIATGAVFRTATYHERTFRSADGDESENLLRGCRLRIGSRVPGTDQFYCTPIDHEGEEDYAAWLIRASDLRPDFEGAAS